MSLAEFHVVQMKLNTSAYTLNEWKKDRIYFAFHDENDNIGKKWNKSQTNGESVALFVHIEEENNAGILNVYWMIPCAGNKLNNSKLITVHGWQPHNQFDTKNSLNANLKDSIFMYVT